MNKPWSRQHIKQLRQNVKRPDYRIFLVMLVASALAWVFEKMGHNYSVVVEAEIECTNLPDGYKVATDDMPRVRLMVNADGSTLFWKFDADNPMRLQVDMSTMRRRQVGGDITATFYPRRHEVYIQSQLPEHVELRSILTDSIPISLFTVKSKLVPVLLCDQATPAPQYIFSCQPKVQPAMVLIEGPSNIVDTMKAVATQQLEPIVVSDTISQWAQLSLPVGIACDANKVNVQYFAETYTEKQLSIPIRAINIPEGYTFKAFPECAQVRVNVGVSCFELVTATDFDIVADLADISLGSNDAKIKLRLQGQPPHVQNVTYSPLFVEYLLERNKQ